MSISGPLANASGLEGATHASAAQAPAGRSHPSRVPSVFAARERTRGVRWVGGCSRRLGLTRRTDRWARCARRSPSSCATPSCGACAMRLPTSQSQST
eukprot:7133164-Prymnesium_polylepis.1